jgi:nucleotide-binding universal stress UspA family protein
MTAHVEAPLAPVVVGVDRATCASGVEYAAAEARRTGRPLDLVHVAPVGDGWLALIGQDALRVARSRAAVQAGERVPVRTLLQRGDVVEELARAAATAALVVVEQLPPHQQRRRSRAVTAELAARVDAPMVAVPADWVARSGSIVTVGFDPLAPDDVALAAAVREARLRHATLRVVVSGARADLDDRLDALGADACELAIEGATGDPVAALRRAARTSTLLVVGRHAPTPPQPSRLGAVSWSVLQDPPCPVLLTPPGHVHLLGGSAGAA